ncbi:thioesterase-like superfamily-domain-containing protein [Gilbertella persicaria]|uniref:thioesterase-like superfamily-domain-containing protein n=1 Tax=Gilbertella persicaria TaxID=101096 RepID=UPI002220E32A|nr:thioesterase-like superfamily-domain-containing protein [Gilbertella persicaria]KAI8060665.1 thioesterase-like superfamily-domain-containing protein [Gilbertella persicaria]
MAIILDSVIQHFADKYQIDPVALNCFFFNKTIPGHLILEIDELKMSKKGYCIVRCILKQRKDLQPLVDLATYNPSEWQDKVQGIFTMGNMDNEQGVTYYYKAPQPPNPDTLKPYRYMFMSEYLTTGFDLSTMPKSDTEPGKPEVMQKIGFNDGRPIDYKSIPYWCDMFTTPPTLLGPSVLGGPVWCPTMQLEVQFKRKPVGKEVFGHYVANHIINGRFDITGELWTEQGDILALTRHQCLVVPWSRNSSDESSAKKRLDAMKTYANKL